MTGSSPWSARWPTSPPARRSSPHGWWRNDPKHGWQFAVLDYAMTAPAATPPSQDATPPRRELRGVVERLTYQNPENGYTVARLAPERPRDEARAAQGDDRLVTLVGTLADLTPGEAIVAHGWWQNDPKHGWQFQVLDYRTSLPATAQGMRRYLGSGLVKGVGPVMAGRIVDAFGDGTFAVIDATPERLTEVPGIGKVRAGRIAATWVEQRHIREVMTALQGYGVSTSLAVRIYKRFGDDSGRVVSQEPYRLAREVWGIGFKTADKIAQAVGIALDAPERLQAGVLHAMGTAGDEGHTLLPEGSWSRRPPSCSGRSGRPIAAAIAALVATGDVVAARGEDARSCSRSRPSPARSRAWPRGCVAWPGRRGRPRGADLRRGRLGGGVRLAGGEARPDARAGAGGGGADGAHLPGLAS